MDNVNMTNEFIEPEIAEIDPRLIEAIESLEEYQRTYEEVSRRFETALESGRDYNKYGSAMDELSTCIADKKEAILDISGADESFFASDIYKKIMNGIAKNRAKKLEKKEAKSNDRPKNIIKGAANGAGKVIGVESPDTVNQSYNDAKKKASIHAAKHQADEINENVKKVSNEEIEDYYKKSKSFIITLKNLIKKRNNPGNADIEQRLETYEEKVNVYRNTSNLAGLKKIYEAIKSIIETLKQKSQRPAMAGFLESDEYIDEIITEFDSAMEALDEIKDADDEVVEENSDKKSSKSDSEKKEEDEEDDLADEYEVRAVAAVNNLRQKALELTDKKEKSLKEDDKEGREKCIKIRETINKLCGKDGSDIREDNCEAVRKKINSIVVTLTPAMEDIANEEEIQEAVALMESLTMLQSDNSQIVDFMSERIGDIVEHKIYKMRMNYLRDSISLESVISESEDDPDESGINFDDVEQARQNMDLVARMARASLERLNSFGDEYNVAYLRKGCADIMQRCCKYENADTEGINMIDLSESMLKEVSDIEEAIDNLTDNKSDDEPAINMTAEESAMLLSFKDTPIEPCGIKSIVDEACLVIAAEAVSRYFDQYEIQYAMEGINDTGSDNAYVKNVERMITNLTALSDKNDEYYEREIKTKKMGKFTNWRVNRRRDNVTGVTDINRLRDLVNKMKDSNDPKEIAKLYREAQSINTTATNRLTTGMDKTKRIVENQGARNRFIDTATNYVSDRISSKKHAEIDANKKLIEDHIKLSKDTSLSEDSRRQHAEKAKELEEKNENLEKSAKAGAIGGLRRGLNQAINKATQNSSGNIGSAIREHTDKKLRDIDERADEKAEKRERISEQGYDESVKGYSKAAGLKKELEKNNKDLQSLENERDEYIAASRRVIDQHNKLSKDASLSEDSRRQHAEKAKDLEEQLRNKTSMYNDRISVVNRQIDSIKKRYSENDAAQQIEKNVADSKDLNKATFDRKSETEKKEEEEYNNKISKSINKNLEKSVEDGKKNAQDEKDEKLLALSKEEAKKLSPEDRERRLELLSQKYDKQKIDAEVETIKQNQNKLSSEIKSLKEQLEDELEKDNPDDAKVKQLRADIKDKTNEFNKHNMDVKKVSDPNYKEQEKDVDPDTGISARDQRKHFTETPYEKVKDSLSKSAESRKNTAGWIKNMEEEAKNMTDKASKSALEDKIKSWKAVFNFTEGVFNKNKQNSRVTQGPEEYAAIQKSKAEQTAAKNAKKRQDALEDLASKKKTLDDHIKQMNEILGNFDQSYSTSDANWKSNQEEYLRSEYEKYEKALILYNQAVDKLNSGVKKDKDKIEHYKITTKMYNPNMKPLKQLKSSLPLIATASFVYDFSEEEFEGWCAMEGFSIDEIAELPDEKFEMMCQVVGVRLRNDLLGYESFVIESDDDKEYALEGLSAKEREEKKAKIKAEVEEEIRKMKASVLSLKEDCKMANSVINSKKKELKTILNDLAKTDLKTFDIGAKMLRSRAARKELIDKIGKKHIEKITFITNKANGWHKTKVWESRDKIRRTKRLIAKYAEDLATAQKKFEDNIQKELDKLLKNKVVRRIEEAKKLRVEDDHEEAIKMNKRFIGPTNVSTESAISISAELQLAQERLPEYIKNDIELSIYALESAFIRLTHGEDPHGFYMDAVEEAGLEGLLMGVEFMDEEQLNDIADTLKEVLG